MKMEVYTKNHPTVYHLYIYLIINLYHLTTEIHGFGKGVSSSKWIPHCWGYHETHRAVMSSLEPLITREFRGKAVYKPIYNHDTGNKEKPRKADVSGMDLVYDWIT